jgi:hypothetical protein
VPEHDGRLAQKQLTLDDAEVRAAHSAGTDPHKHLVGGGLGLGDFDGAQGTRIDGGGGYEDTGLRGLIIPRSARIA